MARSSVNDFSAYRVKEVRTVKETGVTMVQYHGPYATEAAAKGRGTSAVNWIKRNKKYSEASWAHRYEYTFEVQGIPEPLWAMLSTVTV